MTLGQAVWRVFALVYGITCFAGFFLAVIRDRALFQRRNKEETQELCIAQRRYWALDREPFPGFTHNFFTLRNGLKLHYVLNSEVQAPISKNVVIFIHGFPDSFVIWRNLLQATSLQSNILIALDLPGYGGSDGLQTYGAHQLLEAITEFVIAMRIEHLKIGKLVIVSHDWGTVIAARLASEADHLADHWILSSAIIPQLTVSNARSRAASATQMLRTYLRRPWWHTFLLSNACKTMRPVFSQLRRSFYIFIINLPYPLAKLFVTAGDYWFLKKLHNLAVGLPQSNSQRVHELVSKQAMDCLAIATGPGAMQIEQAQGKYSATVRKRTRDYGMSEKIRIYREGFTTDVWEKSLETVIGLSEIPVPIARSGSGAGLFEDGPPGALRASATVLYGQDDPGFDARLALEGISDYLVKGSQVLFLRASGHWLPLETLGSSVFKDVIEWALNDETRALKDSLNDLKEVQFLVDK